MREDRLKVFTGLQLVSMRLVTENEIIEIHIVFDIEAVKFKLHPI